MTTLRVVSYNTRDFLDDPAAAARVVRALAPDVLCLQEVPRRPGTSVRVDRFARACGLRWPGRSTGAGGTTVMVGETVPLQTLEHRRLPVGFLERRRGYAVARIALPGRVPVVVASLHLSLGSVERVRHALMIRHALAAYEGEIVLAGDLNEHPDGPAARVLARGLADVGPPDPSFPAARPRSRIDVLLASPGLRARQQGPVPYDPADAVAASDHLPIWADLDVPAVGHPGD